MKNGPTTIQELLGAFTVIGAIFVIFLAEILKIVGFVGKTLKRITRTWKIN